MQNALATILTTLLITASIQATAFPIEGFVTPASPTQLCRPLPRPTDPRLVACPKEHQAESTPGIILPRMDAKAQIGGTTDTNGQDDSLSRNDTNTDKPVFHNPSPWSERDAFPQQDGQPEPVETGIVDVMGQSREQERGS